MHFLLLVSLVAASSAPLLVSGTARADDDVPPITVRPHLVGADGLRLEQQGPSDDDDDWTKACDAPCDRAVRLDGTYRVAGPDIASSSSFRLHGKVGERVVVTVDRTSSERRETGKIILIAGVVGVGAGLTILTAYALASLGADASNAACGIGGSSASCQTSLSKGPLWIGAGSAAVGVAAMITGLTLMSPTSARQGPVVNVDAPPEDRWAPTPQVNGPASWLAPRPATELPLLSGTF